MKAIKIGMLLGISMAVTANVLPGLYQDGHHLTGPLVKVNDEANFDVPFVPATLSQEVAARAIVDVPAIAVSATAGASIDLDNTVDFTLGSVDNVVDSILGSVNNVVDYTRGAVDIDSTLVIDKRDPGFGFSHSLRPIPTSELPLIVPRACPTFRPHDKNRRDVEDSLRTACPGIFHREEAIATPTSSLVVFTHPLTTDAGVVPRSAIPLSATTEVVTSIPTSTPESVVDSTDTSTRTITQAARTITQSIALNPLYVEPSTACTRVVTTVTKTVTSTNVSALPSHTTVAKLSNVSLVTDISAFTTSTIDACKFASLPGFVGYQLPSGASSCATGSVATTSTASGNGPTMTPPPYSGAAVGTNNVKVAFLVGFAALVLLV